MPAKQNMKGDCQVFEAQQSPAAIARKSVRFSVPPLPEEFDALVEATNAAFPSAYALLAYFVERAALAKTQNSITPALTQEPHGL